MSFPRLHNVLFWVRRRRLLVVGTAIAIAFGLGIRQYFWGPLRPYNVVRLDAQTAVRFYFKPDFYRGKLDDFDVILYDVTINGEPQFKPWDCDVVTGNSDDVNWQGHPRYVAYYSSDHQVVGFAREQTPTQLYIVYDIASHSGAPGMRKYPKDFHVQSKIVDRLVEKLNEANNNQLDRRWLR